MNYKKITGLVLALAVLAASMVAAEGTYEYTEDYDEHPNYTIEATDDLSAKEIEGLLLMREEEKLARDVYLTLADIWNVRTFSNIAGSEQQHMDAVGSLLDAYGIDDPVTDNAVGAYTNTALYDELIAQGSESVTAAFTIGATIEDLDIKDLQELMDETENDDIEFVYSRLLSGSENHMKSFTGQLANYGETYNAQYVEDEYLEDLLDDNSRGNSSNRGSQSSRERGGRRS